MTTWEYSSGALGRNCRRNFSQNKHDHQQIYRRHFHWFSTDNSLQITHIQLQLQLHSSTIVLRGVMQCCRLVGKGESSASMGTAGDWCVVSGGQVEVRSRRQEPRWRNFVGRWTCLPAKRTSHRGQPNRVTDVTNPRLAWGRQDHTSDTVEGQSSDLELYPRSDWQPVKSVTKHRCNVLVFADRLPTTVRAAAFSTICSLREHMHRPTHLFDSGHKYPQKKVKIKR